MSDPNYPRVPAEPGARGTEVQESAESVAKRRFFTAAGGTPPTDDQKAAVAYLQSAIVEVATRIEQRVPNGRNKSLALTALEDVQMRANRGIFAPEGMK